MGWWREAQTGAAREFGRRHYRFFAGLAMLRSSWRLLVVLLVVGVITAGVWALRRAATSTPAVPDLGTAWVQPALVIAGVVLVLLLGALIWRRWGVILRMYWPLGDAAAVALVAVLMLSGAAAAWVWLP